MVADTGATIAASGPSESGAGGIILVVEDEPMTRGVIVESLQGAGYEVHTAADGLEALVHVAEFSPDLVISDVTMPNLEGVQFLRELRSDIKTNAIPFIFLTSRDSSDDVVRAFEAGADDYIVKPVRPVELVARVAAKLKRPPIPFEQLAQDRRSGLFSEPTFLAECEVELERARREFLPASLAYLELLELPEIRERFGERGEAQIARDMAALLNDHFASIARLGRDGNGRFMLLTQTGGTLTREFLNELPRPVVGFATRTGTATLDEMCRRASVALNIAAAHLDLQAVRYNPNTDPEPVAPGPVPLLARWRAKLAPLRLPLQIAAMVVAGFVVPFAAYWFLAARGFDISDGVYLFCVVMLFLTAVSIWAECLLALPDTEPPQAQTYPAGSAIIAAYLPNEAATVVETVEAFLRVPYAGELQIILAYNTPRALPIEEELLAISKRDPRFMPVRIHGSTSKAQNVNAALRMVRGAFVGVFDADHHPDPDSFTRAWNWLADGYDVVQGHCVIRNGDASLVAQLVATEFESIYAVSHPGRARLHGFGMFGGSNGYWKTELLRQTRMHGFMLTEDIDSSLRIVEAGHRIANDRNLISRELAPISVRALWNQRLRWAQGWFQVSLKHLMPALKSPHLGIRQKIGMVHLLFWRECFVWITAQMVPIFAYWVFVRHDHLNWFVPIFLVTTILTALTGPFQMLFSYVLADAEIRKQRGWFVRSLILSIVLYSEFKNVISRLGQVKEAMRERIWKVTPRSQAPDSAA